MKRPLSLLLTGQPLLLHRHGPEDAVVSGFNSDSRLLQNGEMFFALPGEQRDGNAFIPKAIANGASAVVSQKPYASQTFVIPNSVAYLQVSDAYQFMAETAARFYETDKLNMTMIGVTGTNGKTTIATLIHHLAKSFLHSTIFIGTTGIEVAGVRRTTDYTTPPSYEIHKLLREGYDRGARLLVMEVSSHALKFKRVWGMAYDAAIFTNLTHEHREIHPTMEDYYQTKLQLFGMLKPNGFAMINTDDPYGEKIFQHGKICNRKFFDYGQNAKNFKLVKTELDPVSRRQKILFQQDGKSYELQSPMIGEYNAYNVLAAYATLVQLGFDAAEIQSALPSLPPVEGRFEWLRAGNFNVIIDFAHTPDGLEKLLTAVRSIRGEGRVITIFGCPGSRDPSKRPLMGGISTRLSDHVIITTDDVHFEEPKTIIEGILSGVQSKNYEVIEDRRMAIAAGLKAAQTGDFVVIAGRGHERFQYVKDEKIPFVDKDVMIEEARKLKLSVSR